MAESPKDFSSVLKVIDNQIQVPDLSDEEGNVALAQFQAIQDSQDGKYFSVEINQMDDDAAISIGVSQLPELQDSDDEDDDDDGGSSSRAKKARESDGVGYFSDTGNIVSCARTGNSYHRGKFTKGTSIGVLGEYFTDKKSILLFFKNGRPIHRQWVSLPPANLFPTLNVWWGPAELSFHRNSPPHLEQTDLSCWLKSKTLVSDNRKLQLSEDIEMAPSTALAPFHLNGGYFEVKIENAGPLSSHEFPVVIGLTSAESGSRVIPGLQMESIGYHGDEGKVYHEDDEKTHNLGDNCKCKCGDRLGCGVVYVEAKDARLPQKVVVYFTKNGKHIFHKGVNQPNGGFYPAVAIRHAGDVVSVNMECDRPSFDFEAWKREATKSGGAFSELPEFKMPDLNKPLDLEDDQLEGIMVNEFRFAEEIGGMRTDGTVTPTQVLKKARMIQCTQTLNNAKPHFSVAVSEIGYDSTISVGITRSSQTVGTLPGHLSETIGYDCNGDIFRGARHRTARFETEEYGQGDSIGCQLEYSGEVHILSFTKNGRLMGRGQVSNSNKNDLMPSIGFKHMPSTVRPKWSHKPSQELTFQQGDLNHWIKSPGLEINGSVLKMKRKSRKTETQMLTAPHPLTKDRSFFAVKVLSRKSKKKGPTIGISNHSHVASRSSGYRDLRFHSNHNEIITKGISKHPEKVHLDSPAGLANDVIGCGVVFAESDQSDDKAKQFVVVYFTVNGSVVSHQILEQPDGGFYPVVTVQTYGDKLELDTTFKVPSLPQSAKWIDEAQATIKDHKKKMKAMQKETDSSRKARPASPVERPTSHLNKVKVYITCDAQRWNEATFIKAGLDSYGFNAMLLSKDRVAKGSVELDIEPRIKSCHVIVCCITPEYCNCKHAPMEMKLAQKYNKPILLAVMERTEWPPAGKIQQVLQQLTTYRIEMYSDFEWGTKQLDKQVQEVRGAGYNAVEVHVQEGRAANLLYSDAQRGSKTQNAKSDPNALKKAVADADKMKAKSLGNTPTSPARQHGNVQKNSTACLIL